MNALEIHNMAGHLIRRLNQISTSVFQSHLREAGEDLTAVQFAALNALVHHPGLDQAGIAGIIAYDRATIGGVIDRLETKGLVVRVVSPKDRRARQVSLTEAGDDVLARMTPVVRALQSDILSGLNADERTEFLRLARKAADAGNHLSRAPKVVGAPDARRPVRS